jgi:hypothetical protein
MMVLCMCMAAFEFEIKITMASLFSCNFKRNLILRFSNLNEKSMSLHEMLAILICFMAYF